jgi:hypothetical protein
VNHSTAQFYFQRQHKSRICFHFCYFNRVFAVLLTIINSMLYTFCNSHIFYLILPNFDDSFCSYMQLSFNLCCIIDALQL